MMTKTTRSLILAFSSLILLSNLDGAFPENTGAPDELTCGRAPCHNVPVNVGSAQMSILFSGADQKYVPDSVYQLTVRIVNPQTVRNGFEILALNTMNQNTGAWILLEPDKMKVIPGIGHPSRKYVTHRAAGNLQTEWTVAWKAPAAGASPVTFYASVNATNNNGALSGDDVYTGSITVPPAGTSAATDPADEVCRIFPTLTSAGIWVEIPPAEQKVPGTLFDCSGRVRLGNLEFSGGRHYLDLSQLPPSIYFLVLESAGRRELKRFVVL